MMRTKIDWWAFRVRAAPELVREALRAAFVEDGLQLWLSFNMRQKGYQGYVNCQEIAFEGSGLGLIAYGGESQKGWVYVSFTGEGCGWVTNFTVFESRLRLDLHEFEFEHKRVDIALDIYDGSVTYEDMEAAYAAGKFDPRSGPRPQRDRHGVPERGRTFEVAKRTSDRFVRGYEKGLKHLAEHPELPDFHPVDPHRFKLTDWFRVELECKPQNGPLPADIIARRDSYFAGAYPYLAELLEGVQPVRWIVDPVDRSALSVLKAIRQLQTSAGSQLKTLVHVLGDPAEAVRLVTEGSQHSERMVRAGALLVSREDLERVVESRTLQKLVSPGGDDD